MILLQCLIYHITSTIGIIFSINQSMLFSIKTISPNYEHCTEWYNMSIFFSIFFFAVINLFIQVSHYACHKISKSYHTINSINPIHWFCIVCIIISYVHFCELQIRQAFSCPRPILILNLEALLFCFDKHEYDLNFNMHVL